MARGRSVQQRLTLCTHCDEPLEVDVATKSTSCPACNSRVITEAMRVKDYVAVRNLRVANHVTITRKGHVVATIRADELDIEGRLRGGAIVLQGIRVSRKAEVEADLRASSLEVEEGASLVGLMSIGPDSMPELERVQQHLDGKAPAERL